MSDPRNPIPPDDSGDVKVEVDVTKTTDQPVEKTDEKTTETTTKETTEKESWTR
jgi:hypothetical protein